MIAHQPFVAIVVVIVTITINCISRAQMLRKTSIQHNSLKNPEAINTNVTSSNSMQRTCYFYIDSMRLH